MESGCIGDDGEKVNAIKANEGEMEVDGSDKADGAAAEVNAEKEAAAHKLAAEGVARARRRSGVWRGSRESKPRRTRRTRRASRQGGRAPCRCAAP